MAEDGLRSLQKKTQLPFNILCRLAWSRSIQLREPLNVDRPDITGKEFNRYSVTAEYDDLMKAITAQAAGAKISDEDFVGKYLKAHVDRGTALLVQDLEGTGSLDAFWSRLLQNIPRYSPLTARAPASTVKVINVNVGEEVGTGEPVICSLNLATNPHAAVIGIPGSGKTQFAKKLLADVRKESRSVNFIFLDYAKGDVGGDQSFLNATGARVHTLPDRPFPVNPFILNSYDETSIRFSAEEKVESISSYEHLGPVQKGLLSQAIEAAYGERRGEDVSYPDFDIVNRQLLLLYEQGGRSEDTLTEVLRKLTTFHLFPTLTEGTSLLDSLSEQTMVVDLHRLPALRELVAFFIIEKLYRELKDAPEAAVDPNTNARELKTLLVIDEAHNYLSKNNIFLEKLIREMRSKGLAVILLSQSPDDFDQKHFDYTELLEFVFVLKCTANRPQSIQKLIRCRLETARTIAPRLANLNYPECYTQARTRSGGEYTHMRAAQFHLGHRQ